MAKLDDKVKHEIVTRLACFEAPSEIMADLNNRGFEVSDVSTITYYDPETRNGRRLAQVWKDLFHQTRKRYSDDLSAIPIAHRGHRLRRLQALAEHAEKMRNYALAAQLYEQAAKEVGGAFLGKAAAGVADVDVSDWNEVEFLERIVGGEDPHIVARDRARWLAQRAQSAAS